MATLIDSYSESNQNSTQNVSSGWFNTYAGQSFTNTSQATLDSCKFYLKKVGTPSGNCTAQLFAHSGTYGTNSTTTGAALATSDTIDVSTFSTSFALVTFTFSGANRVTMDASTYYVIVYNFPTGSGFSNYTQAGIDSSSPSASGNFCNGISLPLTGTSAVDGCFYVYGDIIATANLGFLALL